MSGGHVAGGRHDRNPLTHSVTKPLETATPSKLTSKNSYTENADPFETEPPRKLGYFLRIS